jgi:glycosyltransferase involved in cell wall biosynthesis
VREPDAPTVSVVLPTYNRPEYLPGAIESVLAQSYRDFELIVVDDASTEDPTPIVEGFEDPRVRVIRHRENRGNAAARNTAIRVARGQYLAFLDDDDMWAPDKLAVQVPVLDGSAADEAMVYCARRLVTPDGQEIGVQAPAREGEVFEELLPWGLMACPTVLLKREVLDTVGLFDERLARGVDEDLWRRIARSYRVRYVDRVLVDTREGHADRVSTVRTPQQVREDLFRWQDMLEKFGTELEARPAKYAFVLRRMGERHIQLGEVGAGRRRLFQAIRQRPLRPDAYGMLLGSLFGPKGLAAFLRFKELVMRGIRPVLGRVGGWRRAHYRAPR